MKRGLLFVIHIIFLLFVSTYTFANDSVSIRSLIANAEQLAETDISGAFSLYDQALRQAEASQNDPLIATVLLSESYYYFLDGNYHRVIDDMKRAIPIFERNQAVEDEIKCKNRMGLAWMYLNDFGPSLDIFFDAKKIADKIGNRKLGAALNTNIGLVYESLHDWPNALMYAQKSLDYNLDSKDTAKAAKSYGNIANLYYYQNRYQEALTNFRKAILFCKSAENDYQLATTYSDVGNLFADMGQLDSALHFSELALQFHSDKREERVTEWCHTVMSLGSIWLRMGNTAKAGQFLEDCRSCEIEVPELLFLKSLYTFRADYYLRTNNTIAAVKNYQQLNKANDSLLLNAGNLENQRIGLRYEYDRKAREDSLQYQLKISKQQAASASYRSKMYLSLLGILMLTFIAITVFYNLRKVHQRKRAMALESMRSDLASDLHDDVGSTLSSIQIISSMALAQCQNNPSLEQSISRIVELSSKVSDGIHEIVWSVNPIQDLLGNVVEQLRKLAVSLLAANNIQLHFRQEISEPSIILTPSVRKEVLLIFKEAVNNARKYSHTANIDIYISQKNRQLSMQIKDFGKGFDLKEVELGNGIKNMKQRASVIGGILEIISPEGKGTTVLLKVSLRSHEKMK